MKKNSKIQWIVSVLFLLVIAVACNTPENPGAIVADQEQNELMCKKTLEKLLSAVEDKNLDALKATMSPTGKMQLILPDSKIRNTVEAFVSLHEEWFKDTSWTMETKILNMRVGDRVGTATTEAMYKEPIRDGKPYFNHMIVSYVLEKTDGQWYVVKDHACSIDGTKNSKED